jgi:Fe-S-cluster containining protein
MCGSCCKCIRIDNKLSDIHERNRIKFPGGMTDEDKFHDDFTFIGSFWIKLTKKEIYKIHPEYLEDNRINGQYFRCKFLVDNKCNCHDKRPDVCKGHPWYQWPHDLDYGFFTDKCGYKLAKEKEVNKRIRKGILNPYFNLTDIPKNFIKNKNFESYHTIRGC